MHIKQIVIQGFKSYRDQTLIEPFNPHVNVIVGRNGSGKSNFYNAILFVLSEKYLKLNADERQSLLHEGGGRSVMTAFIEITFDNSDSRLPIDKKEVSIRRTIGLKKDEYRVDSKPTTQREVMSLLESAGFSSSNPYYIVEQGKVTKITLMKDKERLDLLKEVAGTRVYDDRRKESLKIMQETESKKQKIDEVISYIEDRLKELETEKKELIQFQKLDKERRGIEYTLFSKQMQEANEQLEQLEEERSTFHTKTNQLYTEKYVVEEELQKIERELKDARITLTIKQKERDLLEEERQMKVRTRTKLELEIKDRKDVRNTEKEVKGRAKRELEDLRNKIQLLRNKLDEIIPKFDTSCKHERAITEDLSKREQRLNELFSKQGRKSRFKTQQERDKWIDEEVASRRKINKQQADQVARFEKELKDLDTTVTKLSQQLKEKTSDIEEKKKSLDQFTQKYTDLKKKRDELTNERKELWKQQNSFDQKNQQLKDELNRAEKNLEGTTNKSVNKGVQAVMRIVREQKIGGVYGTILELFTVPEKYKRAAEMAAGNSLFNIVVDTDEVATKILEIMNRQEAQGRVSFMPLNKLNPKLAGTEGNNDIVPLVKKLEYEKIFEKVFQQIFGKTFVCKTLEEGSQFAREHKVNCVSIKGDQVSNKGALSGGYYDFKRSRIDAMKTISDAKNALKANQKDAKKTIERLNDLDNSITKILSELNKVETEVHKLRSTINQEQSEIRIIAQREKALQDAKAQTENSLATLRLNLQQQEATIISLESEKNTSLDATLSADELREQDSLVKQIETLKKELAQTVSIKMELEAQKKDLQNQLGSNLVLREHQIEEQVDNMEMERKDMSLEQLERDLQKVEQEELDNATRKTHLETANVEAQRKVEELSKSLEEQRAVEQRTTRKIDIRANELEKLLNKRKILLQKKEDSIRQIRELGTMPSDAAQFADLSLKELMNRLQSTNEELKKVGHINKKALDQYEQFVQQKKDFTTKKDEIDEGAKAIKDLIQVLDQRKDEAISRTFKQVSKNFSDIFEELVPGGKASLVMKRSASEEEAEESDEEKEGSRKEDGVKQYTGVSIKVQFTGASEARIMQQLSGGQKSLVALTLIFAIQRCDPAPFYLFDEIDSALDSNYRTAIAKMIEKLTQTAKTQFICTTFKPELIDVSHQFYQITFKHKVSGIQSIDKVQALKVLAEEEEGVQQQIPEDEVQMDE